MPPDPLLELSQYRLGGVEIRQVDRDEVLLEQLEVVFFRSCILDLDGFGADTPRGGRELEVNVVGIGVVGRGHRGQDGQ